LVPNAQGMTTQLALEAVNKFLRWAATLLNWSETRWFRGAEPVGKFECRFNSKFNRWPILRSHQGASGQAFVCIRVDTFHSPFDRNFYKWRLRRAAHRTS
jgi:hypothetical protein